MRSAGIVAEGLKQGRSGTYRGREPDRRLGQRRRQCGREGAAGRQTWLLTFDIHAVLPSLIANLPYNNEKDLVPVTLIGTSPMVFVTGRQEPVPDLRADGRARQGEGRGSTTAPAAPARSGISP